MGQKRTFSDTLSNVRFRGQSGHPSNVDFLFFYIAGFALLLSRWTRPFLRGTEFDRILILPLGRRSGPLDPAEMGSPCGEIWADWPDVAAPSLVESRY